LNVPSHLQPLKLFEQNTGKFCISFWISLSKVALSLETWASHVGQAEVDLKDITLLSKL